ncbi:hypothetical protein D3C73_1198760 [compost metagenome]
MLLGVACLFEGKSEDNRINKKEENKKITVPNDQVVKAAKEEFMKYRGTFKKLSKN